MMKMWTLLAVMFVALAGCATTAQDDEVSSRLDQIEQTANEALELAQQAQSDAQEASQAVSGADSKAQRALDAANAASERARRISETCCARK